MELNMRAHTHTQMSLGKNMEIINVCILIVILYYNFPRCCYWGELNVGCRRLSYIVSQNFM